MGKKGIRWAALCFALSLIMSCADAQAARSARIQRVFLIVFENTDAQDALAQPFFRRLAQSGAYLAGFHGLTHPSQPNYIGLIAGSMLGVADNANHDLEGDHLGDLVDRAGKTWKVYAEDYPGQCFLGARSGNYVRKHVPFLSFKNIQNDPVRCAQIVDAQELHTDLKRRSLPDFSLYIPNNLNNAHDRGIAVADQWFEKAFGPLLGNRAFMEGTLFIVTFDEGARSPTNDVYTVFLGDSAAAGAVSNVNYNHYNLLKTIESILGLSSLGREDSKAAPITGIWN